MNLNQIKTELALVQDAVATGGWNQSLRERAVRVNDELRSFEAERKIEALGARMVTVDPAQAGFATKIRDAYRSGERNVAVKASDLLPYATKSSSFPDETSEPVAMQLAVGIARYGVDTRFIAANLSSQDLAGFTVSDWRETSAMSVASGSVERDITATDSKATVETNLDLATEAGRLFAVVLSDIPAQLFDATPENLQAFLQTRMGEVLARALDDHVVSQIDASPNISTPSGADALEYIRHALADARAAGFAPSLLAVNPIDGADLDLLSRGTDNMPLFSNRVAGDASPLFGMSIVESPSVGMGEAYLIDQSFGLVYRSPAQILIDPYSGMDKNLVRIRSEFRGLCHVRSANAVTRVTIGATS